MSKIANMTDRDALLALATRCGQASGPDRELDAAIFVSITPEADVIERPPLDGLIDSDTAGWLLRWDPPRRWSDSWRPICRFTASLDAALTLVPEGWEWEIYSDGSALLWMQPGDGGIRRIRTGYKAATPALALCAAALRARAMEAEK